MWTPSHGWALVRVVVLSAVSFISTKTCTFLKSRLVETARKTADPVRSCAGAAGPASGRPDHSWPFRVSREPLFTSHWPPTWGLEVSAATTPSCGRPASMSTCPGGGGGGGIHIQVARASRTPRATTVPNAGHGLRRGGGSLRSTASSESTSGIEVDTVEPKVSRCGCVVDSYADTTGVRAGRGGHPPRGASVDGDLRACGTNPDC